MAHELETEGQQVQQRGSTGSSAAAEVQRLKEQNADLQTKLLEEERKHESASSAWAAEATQLRQRVSALQAKLSEEERQREVARSAAAADMQLLRQHAAELRAQLSAISPYSASKSFTPLPVAAGPLPLRMQ